MTNRWTGLAAASLGLFLGTLDITVNVALPEITRSFATDVATIQWIIICYVGTSTALQLGVGGAADLYGLKRAYLLGIGLYTTAVALIGLSPSFGMMLALRILQAIGTALMLTTAPALVTSLFRATERGRALGLMSGIGTLGLVVGALGGGFLTDQLGWPSIFLARVPFCLLTGALAYVALPTPASDETGAAFDLRGSIALFIGLGSLVLFLSLGGRQGWQQPLVLALGATAMISLATLGRFQSRERPVFEFALLGRRVLASAVTVGFLMAMATFVNLFILPFYVADVLQADAKTLGFLLMLQPVAAMIAAPAGGWLCDRFSPVPILTFSLASGCAVLFWFGSLGLHSEVFDVAIPMALLGLAQGMFQPSSASIIMSNVPAGRLATGGALMSLSGGLGIVTSVAVMSTIFATLMASHAEAGVDETEAFVLAFSDIYRIAAALALAATAVSTLCWGGARSN
jgi:EmrB/QacA subfamily drug resistance transporter